MVSVSIDFSVDNTPQSLIAFLKKTAVLRDPQTHAWGFDLTKCPSMGIDSAAIIIADSLDAEKAGKICVLSSPDDNPSLDTFMYLSGMKHFFTGSEQPKEDNSDSLVIPTQIRSTSTFHDPEPIIKLIHRHAAISEEAEEYLRICVNEVIQNVEDHACSPFGCVTCAQLVPDAKEVRVAVVDRGRGICTTLRSQYPFLTNATDALAHVLSGGYSAKSRPNNMGLGLSNLSSIIAKQLHGQLLIISEDAYAEVHGMKPPTTDPLGTYFPGTGVFFTIPVQ